MASSISGKITVAELIVEQLIRLGVRHVFGVGGANIEDMFAAVQRRRPAIQVVLGKHEHAAGTAADAYARLTGGLGAVLVTSGGGAMNLVHASAEARASRVPLLAIVGEPPSELQGRGAFQDTSGRGDALDAARVFAAAAAWCARVEHAEDVPRLLAEALEAALGTQPGPAVLLIAKDRQRAELSSAGPREISAKRWSLPDPSSLRRAAEQLSSGPVVIIAGDDVARVGAQSELAALASDLDAQVAVTPEGRDAFDNYSPRFLGPSGAMGEARVARALELAHTCLLVGTRLPLLARQGLEGLLSEKTVISVGRERPFAPASSELHLAGELPGLLRALRAQCSPSPLFANATPERASVPAHAAAPNRALTLDSALAVIERAVAGSTYSSVIVDAGNTGAAAVHGLRVPLGCRWLLAMGMAGMGYSFGAAVGAVFATGKRCLVLAGDGAFLMNGLDVHTAVEHRLPITYVIFNNRAHGMCLVRERLLLGENAGYNGFQPSHLGQGMGAMLPQLWACDCHATDALEQALARAATSAGPSLISLELDDVEIPPFAAFRKIDGVTTVSR
ncbi:MAG: thiamine pyrophosphate-binding protein [Myxococcales bacterium]